MVVPLVKQSSVLVVVDSSARSHISSNTWSLMKLLPALVSVSLLVISGNQANAAEEKIQAVPKSPGESLQSENDNAQQQEMPDGKRPLDFDFFGEKPVGTGPSLSASTNPEAAVSGIEQKAQTRRWMLKTHQTLGLATWALMAATVTLGQLNYNQLYGGGGGSPKWQTPHQILVLSTSLTFAASAAFAIFAPTPYKRPMQLDTGLLHRIAVIGATLGMVTEGVLGIWTSRQANAGNPNNLRTIARAHQIVGYSTFGLLSIAGAAWVF
jgi:cytochrome b561